MNLQPLTVVASNYIHQCKNETPKPIITHRRTKVARLSTRNVRFSPRIRHLHPRLSILLHIHPLRTRKCCTRGQSPRSAAADSLSSELTRGLSPAMATNPRRTFSSLSLENEPLDERRVRVYSTRRSDDYYIYIGDCGPRDN